MAKNCLKGIPCGATCISKNRKCLKAFSVSSSGLMTQLQIAVVQESLSETEKEVIDDYTRMNYEPINMALRGEIPSDEEIDEMVSHIDNALAKLPSTGPDILLSRVETYYREDTQDRVDSLKRLKPGDTYSDNGFMSMTSIVMGSFNIREVVDDYVLDIPSISYFRSTISEDRKTLALLSYRGSQAKNIAKYSQAEEENEHLMPRGSRTTVKGVKTTVMEDGTELLEIELGD